MLTAFAEEIWLAAGPEVTVAGFRYPTRMAVLRLADGGLVLWSPVACDAALRAAVGDLGPVRHLVAPNSLHHLAMGEWQGAYPDATLHAAPGLAKKRPDLRIDATLGDVAPAAWAGQIELCLVPGNVITQEVVFFHRASGTVPFTDLLQQFPEGWFSGWRAVVARADRMVGAEPAVPRKFRLAFVRRGPARAAVRRILDWPVERVIVAHGAPVARDGGAVLRRAFGWLTG